MAYDYDEYTGREVHVLKTALLATLAARRRALSLSQAELAERADANRMTIARAEGEGGDPQLSTFLAMAIALGLTTTVQAVDANGASPAPHDLVHRGLAFIRTKHDLDWKDRQREAALAKAWEAANVVEPVGLRPVLTTLVPGCTQAQASAAATTLQWLGSDIGFDFLQQALGQAGYDIVARKASK